MLRVVMVLLVIFAVCFMFAIMYIDLVWTPGQHVGALQRHVLSRTGRTGLGRTLDGCPYGKDRMHEIARLEEEIYGKILSQEAEEHMRNCRGTLTWS